MHGSSFFVPVCHGCWYLPAAFLPSTTASCRRTNQNPTTKIQQNEPFRPTRGRIPSLGKVARLPRRTDLRGPCQPPRQHPGAERWQVPVHPSEPLRHAALRHRPLSRRTGRSPGCSAGDDDARPRLPPAGPADSPPCPFCRSTTERRKLGNAGRRLGAGREPRSAPWRTNPATACATDKVWKLDGSGTSGTTQGMIVARRQSREAGDTQAEEETLTFDAATRIWRGREFLGVRGTGRRRRLACQRKRRIARRPSRPARDHLEAHPERRFLRASTSRTSGWTMPRSSVLLATQNRERTRPSSSPAGCPLASTPSSTANSARATVTATLFGGMDNSLYADFRKGSRALLAASENTLKHWAGGTAGTAQMASKGPITRSHQSGRSSAPGQQRNPDPL